MRNPFVTPDNPVPAARPIQFATPRNPVPAIGARAAQVPPDQIELPDPPFLALRALRRYFLAGGRYAYEGRAGAGAFGSVYTLRRVDDGGDGGGQQQQVPGRRVAAKLARRFPDPRYAGFAPLGEVEALESFASAAHVVRRIGSQTFGGPDLYGVREWILLEFLEGGAFRDFEARVQGRNKALPNRLLWSIFRCLMRIAMGMAYSGGLKEGPVRLETAKDDDPHPQEVLYNTDMHTNNRESPASQ
ncbi:hypothetical protein PG985_008123 [Apiospora marii]|uniref:uncharacterized protein n=1 Tax=Apiospora marii TaxID=335849 RepID=UPI00312FD829